MLWIQCPPLSPSLVEIPLRLLEEAEGGAEEGAPAVALDLQKQGLVSLQCCFCGGKRFLMPLCPSAEFFGAGHFAKMSLGAGRSSQSVLKAKVGSDQATGEARPPGDGLQGLWLRVHPAGRSQEGWRLGSDWGRCAKGRARHPPPPRPGLGSWHGCSVRAAAAAPRPGS